MRWSKVDVALLSLRYKDSSWDELLSLFPGRTRSSIKRKATSLKLTRPNYSPKRGYFISARCSRHGRIFRTEIKWGGKKGNIPYCPRPYCGKRLRTGPLDNRLRKKYRIEDKENV